jgi:hypothetical protein
MKRFYLSSVQRLPLKLPKALEALSAVGTAKRHPTFRDMSYYSCIYGVLSPQTFL